MSIGDQDRSIQRDRQRMSQMDTAIAEQIDGRIKQIHTCLPGIITAYDAVKQTVSVQPAIKRIFTERGPLPLPLCLDVPVVFPSGGGFALTFPIQPDDECLIVFSERSIDKWWAFGGIQEPGNYRFHDLSDGFAICGVRSLANPLASVNTVDAELRNGTNNTRIAIKANGAADIITASGVFSMSSAGAISVTAPGGVTITGDLTVSGTITGQTNVVAGTQQLKTHKHTGVTAGAAQTGLPTG